MLTKKKKNQGGRNVTPPETVELVIQLKKENGVWGAPRIQNELKKLGISISQPTIQKILRENGLSHRPDPNGNDNNPFNFEPYRSTAKDMMWALDFFVVKTVKGMSLNVLIIIDPYTRELIELKTDNGLTTDSAWTISTLNNCIRNQQRQPEIMIHDRGTQFENQFKRGLAVLDIESEL